MVGFRGADATAMDDATMPSLSTPTTDTQLYLIGQTFTVPMQRAVNERAATHTDTHHVELP